MNQTCDQTHFTNTAGFQSVRQPVQQIIHGPGPGDRSRVSTSQWRGLGYLLGITGTIAVGTIFVLVGIGTGATGWTAIVFAAGFPLAAMLWALALTLLQKDEGLHHPVPGRKTGSGY